MPPKKLAVESLSVGPIVGFTTAHSTRLWGRGEIKKKKGEGQRCLGVARLFEDGKPKPVAEGTFPMHPQWDLTGTIDFKDLPAATRHRFEIGLVPGDPGTPGLPPGAVLDWSGASGGQVTTAPDDADPAVSFVLGSCRYLLLKNFLDLFDFHWGQESGDKTFRSMFDQVQGGARTDCLVMMGDQIYADDLRGIDPDNHLSEFHERYARAFSQPWIRQLMSRVPTYMIMDDHEIQDAWTMDKRPESANLWVSAITAYQSYQLVHGPAFKPGGGPDFADSPLRCWYDFEIGAARFFVTDLRTERYRSLVPPQIMGRTQMDNLKAWLKEGSAEAVKFVVGSVPLFPDLLSEIEDKWAGFPAQRNELLAFIRAEKIKRVVVLTGDVHCSAWATLTCDTDPDFRVHTVIASPFFFPGPRGNQAERFNRGQVITTVDGHPFRVSASDWFRGDDSFTRISLELAASRMLVQLFDRKGGLLEETRLPL